MVILVSSETMQTLKGVVHLNPKGIQSKNVDCRRMKMLEFTKMATSGGNGHYSLVSRDVYNIRLEIVILVSIYIHRKCFVKNSQIY